MKEIKTYQDLLEVGESEKERMNFIQIAINNHRSSKFYKIAKEAELYYRHQNPTIMRFQNFIFDQYGRAVPDIWSPNHKISSNWYNYFITQSVQYLLGNGILFKKKDTKDKLGKDFEKKVQKLAIKAKNGGLGFGFWNFDHLEIFGIDEFVPLWDEEDGSLKAGIRFWKIDENKPLRVTFYELDGYTDYIKRKAEDMKVLAEKRTYKQTIIETEIEGQKILDGENYPSFPIVPFWNINRQSELVGNQGTLDAYDLMLSGLINNVSEGELIYWILKNCGGMDDLDDAKFIEQLKITRVAHAEGDMGSDVEAHTVDVPFEASAEALNRLEKQLFKDFMALKVDDISAAAVTNDQIQSAYEPLNQKTDEFEYQVTEFIEEILRLAEIDDEPSYTRSQMSNQSETIQMILSAASYLSEEYVIEKIMTILGDTDRINEVIDQKRGESSIIYESDQQEENWGGN